MAILRAGKCLSAACGMAAIFLYVYNIQVESYVLPGGGLIFGKTLDFSLKMFNFLHQFNNVFNLYFFQYACFVCTYC